MPSSQDSRRARVNEQTWAFPLPDGSWQLIQGLHTFDAYTEQFVGEPVTADAAWTALTGRPGPGLVRGGLR